MKQERHYRLSRELRRALHCVAAEHMQQIQPAAFGYSKYLPELPGKPAVYVVNGPLIDHLESILAQFRADDELAGDTAASVPTDQELSELRKIAGLKP